MRAGAIWQGVQGEYFGPSAIKQDHFAALEAWKADEPIESRWYTVGRLIITSELLDRARAELEVAEGVSLITATPLSLGESLHVDGEPEATSWFLRRFLDTCGRRFAQIAQQDLFHIAPGPQPKFDQEIFGGPYKFFEHNAWHRDSEDPGGVAYMLNVTGPLTEFASGAYRSSQFADQDEQMFIGPEPAHRHIRAAEACDVVVFDRTSALHRAPTPDREGEPRIASNIFVYDVFSPAV